MARWNLERTANPSVEAIHAVDLGLHRHNLDRLGSAIINDYARLAVMARGADDEIVGGIYSDAYWEWIHIRTLWVQENVRGAGLGTALILGLEQLAAEHGIYQAHVETTDFQALGFYQKLGYSIFGELHGKPAGHTWYYLEKRFFPAGSLSNDSAMGQAN